MLQVVKNLQLAAQAVRQTCASPALMQEPALPPMHSQHRILKLQCKMRFLHRLTGLTGQRNSCIVHYCCLPGWRSDSRLRGKKRRGMHTKCEPMQADDIEVVPRFDIYSYLHDQFIDVQETESPRLLDSPTFVE